MMETRLVSIPTLPLSSPGMETVVNLVRNATKEGGSLKYIRMLFRVLVAALMESLVLDELQPRELKEVGDVSSEPLGELLGKCWRWKVNEYFWSPSSQKGSKIRAIIDTLAYCSLGRCGNGDLLITRIAGNTKEHILFKKVLQAF